MISKRGEYKDYLFSGVFSKNQLNQQTHLLMFDKLTQFFF